jgi:hypothetical protein
MTAAADDVRRLAGFVEVLQARDFLSASALKRGLTTEKNAI